MKKLALGILMVVLLLFSYTLGTFNASKVISIPAAKWAEGSDAAKAWREFAASLEVAGARVFAITDSNDERLEGLLYLAQMAAASLEMKLAKGSPVEPRFTDWMGDYRKFLGDSPDAIYHTAELSSAYRYEITGNKHDAEYLGFMLYGRQINGWNRAAANVSNTSLHFDEGGTFRILLSPTKPSDPDVNWLKLEDDTHMIMVRQYYHGRKDKTVANFTIRNLDAPPHQPPGESEVAKGLRDAASFFNDTLDGAIALTKMLSVAPNNIDPPASYSSDFGGVFYPTQDNEYFGTWFSLKEDEALVIEGTVPDAPYWGMSLQSRWMQSLDYEHYQIELNDHQIATRNGRYRVVVSHQKPPSGDWLDTAGRHDGLLAIRYQQSSNSEKPSIEVVKYRDL